MICFSSTHARLETGFVVSVPTGLSKIRRHFSSSRLLPAPIPPFPKATGPRWAITVARDPVRAFLLLALERREGTDDILELS